MTTAKRVVPAVLARDNSGMLHTTVALHRLPDARRIAVARIFMHRPVRVVASYLRSRENATEWTGTLVTSTAVSHGTCTSVLVIQRDDEQGPIGIPLSQVLDIVQTGGHRIED